MNNEDVSQLTAATPHSSVRYRLLNWRNRRNQENARKIDKAVAQDLHDRMSISIIP